MKNNRKAVQELIKVVDHDAETITEALGVTEVLKSMEDGIVDFDAITVPQEVLFLTEVAEDFRFVSSVLQSLVPKDRESEFNSPSKVIEFIINEAPEDVYNVCVTYGFRVVGDKMEQALVMKETIKKMFGAGAE